MPRTSRSRSDVRTAEVTQPVTDDSIRVRHGDDVTYDVGRRVLMFGTTAVGH